MKFRDDTKAVLCVVPRQHALCHFHLAHEIRISLYRLDLEVKGNEGEYQTLNK
jgi:hypothetical protein